MDLCMSVSEYEVCGLNSKPEQSGNGLTSACGFRSVVVGHVYFTGTDIGHKWD